MKTLMRWDPFRLMRKFDPFEELRAMQREMDRLFDRFIGGETTREYAGAWVPAVDSYIKDGKLVYKAELPGVDPKDLDVSVTDKELVIKGDRKSEKEAKEETYSYHEISYGSFERHFLLPEGAKIDDLKADFTNGVLEITVPVPEKLETARKIKIETKEPKKIAEEAAAKKAA